MASSGTPSSVADIDLLLSSLSVKDEAGNERVLGKDEFDKLLGLLKSQDESVVVRAAQLLGDLARNEENRGVISEAGGVAIVVSLIVSSKSPDVHRVAVRLLGNLAYEQSENRAAVAKTDVIPHIVALLASPNQELQRNAAGCLANLASENQDIQTQIVKAGGVKHIMAALRSNNSLVVTMALRALSNLSEMPENIKAIAAEGVFGSVIDIALSQHEDSDLPSLAASYLVASSEQEPVREAFHAQNLTGRILKGYAESKEEEIKVDLLKTLAYLSLTDSNAPVLFQSLPLFLEVLRAAHTTPDPLIHATMLLGNLARKDESCLAIAAQGAIGVLVNLLRAKEPDVRVLQLALGALRNLGLAATAGNNREKLAEAGVFPLAGALLAHKNAHVVYSSIGLLKIMLGGGEPYLLHFLRDVNLADLVTACTPSETVLVDGGERITFEGGRIIAALCEKADARKRVVDAGGVPPLLRLVASNWTILQFEGARALLKLAEADVLRPEMHADIVAALLALLGGAPSEASIPAVLLLEKLTESEEVRKGLKKEESLNVLRSAVERSATGNTKLHELLTKIVARVTSH